MFLPIKLWVTKLCKTPANKMAGYTAKEAA